MSGLDGSKYKHLECNAALIFVLHLCILWLTKSSALSQNIVMFYSISINLPGSYLVNIDRGEHVLEHGGHHLHVHSLRAKVIKHQQRRVSELLLVHPMPL